MSRRLQFFLVRVCHCSAGNFFYFIRIVGHEGMQTTMFQPAINLPIGKKAGAIVTVSIDGLLERQPSTVKMLYKFLFAACRLAVLFNIGNKFCVHFYTSSKVILVFSMNLITSVSRYLIDRCPTTAYGIPLRMNLSLRNVDKARPVSADTSSSLRYGFVMIAPKSI